MNEIFWIWLSVSLKFNSRAIAKVLKVFSPQGAYMASTAELEEAGLDGTTVERLSSKELDRAEAIMKKCAANGISVYNVYSPDYPKSLDVLDDKPYVIYVRGDLSRIKGKKTAAVIGTRGMSDKGRELTRGMAARLISEGYVIVSGAAEGVDSTAAEVALEKGVPTVAVLGVDIDKYFPKSNTELIDKIAESGAVISEYPPDTDSRFFATRNRIIVGMSKLVAVTEAPRDSGALIGSKLALKKDIPVYASNEEGDSFEGCRELLSLGAQPIESGVSKAYVPTPKTQVSEVKTEKKPEPKAEKPAAKRKSLKNMTAEEYWLSLRDPNGPKIKSEADIPESFTPAKRFVCIKLLEKRRCTENDMMRGNKEYTIVQIILALAELEMEGYILSLPGSRYELK